MIGEDRYITKIINDGNYFTLNISANFVKISGFTIKGDTKIADIGIEISDSSNNNAIIGNIILEYHWGIYLSSSSNNIIKNNNFSCNFEDITLEKNCINNTIVGNTLLNTMHCYSIGIHFSSNNTIIDNIFSNGSGCDCGCIYLYSSDKNVVMNNTITTKRGGISIRYSKENIINGNTIMNLPNEVYSGILLLNATYNTITSNNLICCYTGIRTYENYASNDNTIHHNNFFYNTQNAYDECNNTWDNYYPSGGNFWEDYNGTDGDGDGIGDTPYNISGGDNQDRYPLMEPLGNNLFPIAEFTWAPSHPDPEEIILFNASDSIDYDGNIILYEWDWNNDGVFDENHVSPTATHTFEEVGNYPVSMRITDDDNLTDSITKTVRVENPPPTDPIIEGPSRWPVGVELCITISSTDPDNNTIKYILDWGDGDIVETVYYESGETVEYCHTYNTKGTYIISLRAIDIYGEGSNWVTFEVEIPRTRATSYQCFDWLFERFPMINRLLNIIF